MGEFMKKLALVFLFLISAANVFAVSESDTECDKQYTSSESVASVEAAVPAATATSTSSSSTLGQ